MKQFCIGIMMFSCFGLFSQNAKSNRQFSKLEEVLNELQTENKNEEIFDFLIKYYEDQEKVEERFVGVDNVDIPGDKRTGEFKVNRMTPFNLFPNPTNGNFNIEFFGNKGELRILDASGNLVQKQRTFTKGQYEIEMSDFEKGLYYVEVISNSTSFKRRMLSN